MPRLVAPFPNTGAESRHLIQFNKFSARPLGNLKFYSQSPPSSASVNTTASQVIMVGRQVGNMVIGQWQPLTDY